MTVVTDWYRGQTILVTGGTGFMGKVLLEKLLRSCSEVRRIYVMARPRRGLAPSSRIDEFSKLPLFDKLIKAKPEVLKKLVAVESDLTKPDLGLQKEQRKQLISEVNIVFNMAASLRLEAGMKPAITHNTTGTKQILDLCTEMKQLKAFIHLSTAFCHCEIDILEEKIYPPSHNPADVMHAMEWLDDETIEMITPRLLGTHPNCYTFSKRLSEYLVYEYRDRLPVCVARPSIVVPVHSEPLPGWVDTLNGPVGVLVGTGKGVIHSMMCEESYTAEVVPVDIAINSLIIIAWKLSTEKCEEVPVYNLSSGSLMHVSWGEVINPGLKTIREHPFENPIWYPSGNIRSNWLVHYFYIIFFHYLPAYFIDFLLLLARQKRFMVRLQNRITVGLGVLQHFTMHNWHFENENIIKLANSLSEEDRNIFYTINVDYDLNEFMLKSVLGAREYCMKEPLSSLPRARRIVTILYCLNCLTTLAFYGLLLWLLLHYVDSARVFLNYSAHILKGMPLIGSFIAPDMDTIK